MQVSEIATRQDIERIEAKIDALNQMLSGINAATNDRELTLDQAAQYLSVSTATVKRWLSAGRITNTGTVNKKRFSESELKAIKGK